MADTLLIKPEGLRSPGSPGAWSWTTRLTAVLSRWSDRIFMRRYGFIGRFQYFSPLTSPMDRACHDIDHPPWILLRSTSSLLRQTARQ